ncbi:uncharacterized protein TNCV_2861461 [Trichonephila clavipes]|nr:uncharacterized protein TNCV_2861461 [Trichonephila clavipes]
MLQTYVIPATRLPTRNHIHARWIPTSHRKRSSTNLRQIFTDTRVISRSFPTAWPPRSPDLRHCDFWLWGFLKDKVYRECLTTTLDLKNSILRHINNIHVDSLR